MSDQAPTQDRKEEVARRAYELWETEGRPEGRDRHHWAQAEEEFTPHAAEEGPRVASEMNANLAALPEKPPLGGPAAAAVPKRQPAKRRPKTPDA